MFDMLITVLQRDQADREARFARSCKFATRTYSPNADFTLPSSRTVGNCDGRLVTVPITTPQVAYNGFQPTKDRVEVKTEAIQRYWSIFLLTSILADDIQTSNVFVANLPPHVTEQSLGTFFARMGPVGSVGVYIPFNLPFTYAVIKVKIMWPRGDNAVGPGADMTAARRNRNSGLSGFVSFMKRRDAEAALKEFDGFEWGGTVLRVGWSKAVPLAAKPMYGQ
jgi:hypothetical protein